VFGDAPPHIRLFAAAVIAFTGFGFFYVKAQSDPTGDPQLHQFAMSLFFLMGVASAGVGLVFFLFSGRPGRRVPHASRPHSDSSAGGDGAFWKLLAIIGGVAGIITIVTWLSKR